VIVLVDYDNVPELERNRGPQYVVTRIVNALGPAVAGETELRCRLYGGWFQGSTLSRRAQQLAPALRADFPRAMPAPLAVAPGSIIARVELALALEAAPGKHLTHTYRDRALPSNVHCASLPYSNCRTPGACPIAPLHAFLRDTECPELGCRVELSAVLTKPEQKLVDTMLIVDVLHLARSTKETIAVVSSDDDIWPGIQSALMYGARIVHVHPVPGRTTPSYYSSLATGLYSQSSF
jgi:hypothetical protein